MILVTGGAGFIGTNFVQGWLANRTEAMVNVDALTYAANERNLDALSPSVRHEFVRADVRDRARMAELLTRHRPRAIVHFAAESHVDRSIAGPEAFVQTNVLGTFQLLEAAREYWVALAPAERDGFRFLQVSTDEVYGSLGPQDAPFNEDSPFAPNSPYAASKAAADHLVRAYHHTYGLPTLTTHCSNNYGPHQHAEKLIPLMIASALAGRALPVYGDGANVRDWLHVSDHCAALERVLERGVPGRTYDIGGRTEVRNIDLVRALCTELDAQRPDSPWRPHASLIRFVTDRPGHDRRYAIDCARIERELGWSARVDFSAGLRQTLAWYLTHVHWLDAVSVAGTNDANDSRGRPGHAP